MRTKLRTALFLLFIAETCLAQRNFIKGKLITLDKDTLSGYIDYKEWIKSPLEIFFKREINQSSFVYSSNELSGFIIDFNQETYTSLSFAIEKLPRNGSKIVFPSLGAYVNRNKQLIQKNAFVRVLSTGKVTLYLFVDKDSEEHFLIQNGKKLEPLVYHIIETENKTAKFKQYEMQLGSLLADACKKLPIQNTGYYEKDMKKLVDSYNECFRIILQPAAQNQRSKWEYGIIAGAGYSRITHVVPIGPNTYNFLEGNGSITPAGGVFLNYVFARGRGRFAILNEIHTYSLKSTAHDQEHFYHYDIRYIGLQNLFRYTFYVGEPSIYIIAGISNAIVISDASSIKDMDGAKADLTSTLARNTEQGLIGGIGMRIKRLMLETRSTLGNGFSAGVFNTTPTNRIEITLKWNFGKMRN
ncbi:outer membrane beta-barrel protein [Emticicia sp. 17c]|uniref:outer membrane beta-barrel protein n=1 Tax=Emticicia sp. 17c TaxID=3127704 RepID=UPI00301CF2BE